METLSATQYVQQRPQSPARCKGSIPKQTPVGTAGFTADGFLNHRFLPLYQPGSSLPEQAATETKLFASLSRLEKVYPFTLMDVSDKPYPYNVLLAHWDAERQIDRVNRDTELFVINDGQDDYKFAARETLDTDMHLYYIPLVPLHRLIAGGRDRRSAELLLSVCAYLYHVAGIPHYRDEDGYLNYHYEILTEDLDPAWNGLDKEDIAINKSALDSASHFGDIMQRRMHNPMQLEQFENRVKSCNPITEFHRDCLRVADDTLKLWQDYPNGHLFKNVDNGCLRGAVEDEEEDDYYDEGNNTIALHEYVHFVAEINSGIYQSILEMVNCEFREKMYTQEPAVVTRFDNNLKGEKANLDYEHRLFKIINNVTNILDKLP